VWIADQSLECQAAHRVGDLGAHVTSLRDVSGVTQASHQLRPGVPDADRAPALMTYLAERVAPYKKVRLLEFVDAIPKSPTGKILRRVLVERERRERRVGA